MNRNHRPTHRPRRLRHGQPIRDAVADVVLHPDDLVLPLFICDGDSPQPVTSMPGVCRLPTQDAVRTIQRLSSLGLRQFMLFGVTPPQLKDPVGRYASSTDAPVNRVLQEVRDAGLEALLYADLCFCEYTDHGHCGVLCESDPAWAVDNDATLAMLAQAAAVQAKCGADFVAPSGMMDGQVGAIREGLDAAGYTHVGTLSYSVKYASNLYGPFRDAGGGACAFGDRKGYQMDYRRTREWRTELEADLEQGADMVMVKPALAYLDIVHQVRQTTTVPVAAYQVSGEYAMLHAAAQQGWLELPAAVCECCYAIKRAGADLIVTYFAESLLQWI